MIIQTLRMRNFRNYEKADIAFDEGINILIGDNGQGKTNLLEALVYLSLTRSHRLGDERKLIRCGQPFARVECLVDERGRARSLKSVIHQKGKTLFVQDMPVKKSSEFVGKLNVVMFAPDELRIFSDPPRQRRRMMDQELTKISPSYLSALINARYLLKQRNNHLKKARPDELYLDTLDEAIAKHEATIITERRAFAAYIAEAMPDIYRSLTEEDSEVKIFYQSTIEGESTEENLRRAHHDALTKDREAGTTTCGFHRDDLVFIRNGRNLNETASQGQKREAVMAYKTALLRYIEKVTGKMPVLLLDDVLSELDRNRQKRLMGFLDRPYQCLITATDIPAALTDAKITVYHVKNGTIEKNGGRR